MVHCMQELEQKILGGELICDRHNCEILWYNIVIPLPWPLVDAVADPAVTVAFTTSVPPLCPGGGVVVVALPVTPLAVGITELWLNIGCIL